MAIRNMKDLEKMMVIQIKQWLEKTADEIKDKYIEEFLYSEFYDLYSPTSYDRQYLILKSITKTEIQKVGNTYSIMVFLDPDLVDGYYGDIGSGYPPTDGQTINVWRNMNEGYHGFAEKTDGHFWDELCLQLDNSGKYNVFADFKNFLNAKGMTVVKK